MKIRDIMTTDIAVAEPDTTVEEIATMMRDEDTGAIPVVDEDEELTGIVTDRDIVLRCVAEGEDPAECTAEDVMTDGAESIAPDASVDEAARIMADKQIRRLPVVEDGKLVGMVSLGDLAVKAKDDDLSGDTLEDVSKGVKQEGGRGGGRKPAASARERRAEENVTGAQAGGSQGRIKNAVKRPRVKNEWQEPITEQPQGLRSESSERKQGIAARSSKEENRRQDKVVPFRVENEVRNKNVQKPAKGRKRA